MSFVLTEILRNEPNELPSCSTPQADANRTFRLNTRCGARKLRDGGKEW